MQGVLGTPKEGDGGSDGEGGSTTPHGTEPEAVALELHSPAAGGAARATAARDDEEAKPAVHPDDAINAPKLSPLGVLVLFLGYGVRAFGGPVAQINLMKDELVLQQKWISGTRFNRVFAVYQLLPGPEATELACYFGTLAGGRLGGVMGGLGFILPGFCLMLLFSFLYERWGFSNDVFHSVFLGLQPAVCAMVFRAAHKIGDNAFKDPHTKAFDWRLALVGLLAAFESVLAVNFFIIKAHLAVVYYFLLRRWRGAAAVATVAPLAVFIAVIVVYGRMDSLVPMGIGVSRDLGNTFASHFLIGLLGGLVTFGGAYTAIPFMQYETVTSGHFIANEVFLDSLAVCSILPTPMVMFSTMVGYSSGLRMHGSEVDGVVAAVLMTLGMFTPAFALPVLFHERLEAAAAARGTLAQVLDSVSATVVGLIAVTAVQLLRTAVTKPLDAVIFYGSMRLLYGLNHKYTPVLLVAAAAMAGQLLFYPY